MSLLVSLLLAAVVEIPRLPVAEARQLQEKGTAVVVDVRSTATFEESHIKGAIAIPLVLVQQRAGELPQDKTIITYCSCGDEETSVAAAEELQRMGFERVAALLGGYPAWAEAGFPTESGTGMVMEGMSEPEAAPAPAAMSGGRLAPPAGVTCDPNQLTVYAGEVSRYHRGRSRTTLTIHTDSDTVETVTVNHPGASDPSRFYLIMGEAFTKGDWDRIERRKGVLRPEMRAQAWVCGDGSVIVDWRPGEHGSATR